MTQTETERREIFRASPLLMGFLSTMLEDAQYSERDQAFEDGCDERDTGTIWTVPDVTFNAARAICDTFYSAAPVEESDRSSEQLGSDLYLECAGHGAGFGDRDHGDEFPDVADRLSACVDSRGTLETYLGDDGMLYICGCEV